MQNFSLIPGLGNEFAGLINAAFGSGEPGVWYRPDDPKTQFTTEIATTQVASVGNTVGLAIDQSRGAVLGAELVTNGTFNVDLTGWHIGASVTASVVAAEAEVNFNLSITSTSGNWFSGGPIVSTGDTRFFEIEFDATWVSGTGSLQVGTGFVVSRTIAPNGGVKTRYKVISSLRGGAGSAIHPSAVTFGSANFVSTWKLDNVTCRELPGHHAYQTSASKRPLFARVPARGRVNLLLTTEAMNTSPWLTATGGTGVIAVRSGHVHEAPDSSLTAIRIDFDRGAGNLSADRSEVTVTTSAVTSGAHTVSVWAKAATAGDVGKEVAWRHVGAGAYGVITLTADWVRVARAETGGIANFTIGSRGSFSASNQVSVLLWHPQLEPGTATNYQRVGLGAFDVTEEGQQTLQGWLFDGTDDNLETNTIDMTATDKMAVVSGVQKLSDASAVVLMELSASVSANDGTFYIFAPSSGGANNFQFASKGTVVRTATALGQVAPLSRVVSGVGDISGDISRIRVDGVQSAESVSDQGAGNYGNYKAYVGSRAGTSQFANNYIFGLMFRGTATALPLLQRIEKFIGKKTGNTL